MVAKLRGPVLVCCLKHNGEKKITIPKVLYNLVKTKCRKDWGGRDNDEQRQQAVVCSREELTVRGRLLAILFFSLQFRTGGLVPLPAVDGGTTAFATSQSARVYALTLMGDNTLPLAQHQRGFSYSSPLWPTLLCRIHE